MLDHKAFAFYQPNMMAERIENLYISSGMFPHREPFHLEPG
jgi:hypothetical protein